MEKNSINLDSFGGEIRAAVVGASGGIGRAFVEHLSERAEVVSVHACSRSGAAFEADKVTSLSLDFMDEPSVESCAETIREAGGVNLIVIATGMLHDEGVAPEKSLKDIGIADFSQILQINTIGPALVLKYFLPLIPKDKRSVTTALSARVGSITDNGLGGWYAYRASKSALNMVIKNAAIETGRRYKQAVIAGIHPGTVDTDLSKPFQGNVPEGKLFSPEYSTACMLNVLNGLGAEDSGKCFDYAGQEILP